MPLRMNIPLPGPFSYGVPLDGVTQPQGPTPQWLWAEGVTRETFAEFIKSDSGWVLELVKSKRNSDIYQVAEVTLADWEARWRKDKPKGFKPGKAPRRPIDWERMRFEVRQPDETGVWVRPFHHSPWHGFHGRRS